MGGILSLLDRFGTLLERRTRAAGFALLVLFLLNAGHGALMNSGAGDELAAHIPSGYLYWTSGQFGGGINNFPLGQLLVTLPAGLFRVPYTLYTEEHLFLFRLLPLLMGLTLCALVWLLATKLYGRTAGLAALFFAALCPNLLAHSGLATLDLPVAFLILLSIFLLDRYLARPTIAGFYWLSLAVCAAGLVKVQGLLLVPLVAVALVASARTILPRAHAARRPILLSWLLLPALWFVLTNLVYLHLPGKGGRLLPPLYIEALKEIAGHSQSGHAAYLMGSYARQGWWFFFPVAIAVKTPLPELVLAVIGLARRQARRETLLVTLPILIFLAGAMTSRVNIGLRHILMIYPLLAIAAGFGVVRLRRLSIGKTRGLPVLRLLLAAFILATFAGAAFITPHHLSYFNLLAGGTRNGHRVLVDSNYDWGLNDRYLRRHIAETRLTYKIDPPAFRPTNGPIMVNANALYGVMNRGAEAYSWLKGFTPVDRVAYTWFEYSIPLGTYREEREDVEARSYVLARLFRLADTTPAIDHPGYGTVLARGFAEVGAYDAAYDQIRGVLARNPAYAPALHLGGEITIRRKLGVLYFRGDEYLRGFHTLRPTIMTTDPEVTIAMARRAGLAPGLSRVESDIGNVLIEVGDRDRAGESLKMAMRLDPTNAAAREALDRLGPSP